MILWSAPFVTLVFRQMADNPNPALKWLTFSFLALEGEGLLVPCIRRQRFTRIVKAPKQISCHLELRNLNLCSDHVQAYVHRGENRYLYKIVVVVIYIPIKPRKLQPKNKLPC